MKPVISIVTVCYNAFLEIEKTILSVINQSYSNIEYIVIDGGSKDGTLEIINKYSKNITLLVSEPDNGIYDAMNKSIKLATGEWINFMNAGDIYHEKNTIEKLFANPIPKDKIIVYGDSCLLLENKQYFVPAIPLNDSMLHIPFCHQLAFLKVNYIKEHPFNLKYRIASDYDMIYKIFKNNKNAFLNKPIIVSNYNSDTGFSINNALMGIREETIINYQHITFKLKVRYSLIYFKAFLGSLLPLTVRENKRKKFIIKNFKLIKTNTYIII
ncbi:MAG: glycosyltransferase family 2 protein [Paludibacter sp.]|nr:glycosyltransferase family 2 protein [Paludibacter sp.]